MIMRATPFHAISLERKLASSWFSKTVSIRSTTEVLAKMMNTMPNSTKISVRRSFLRLKRPFANKTEAMKMRPHVEAPHPPLDNVSTRAVRMIAVT